MEHVSVERLWFLSWTERVVSAMTDRPEDIFSSPTSRMSQIQRMNSLPRSLSHGQALATMVGPCGGQMLGVITRVKRALQIKVRTKY